ncbi:MAG: hypothetical protein WC829_03045 [Hyphomicrobium sp.]|jgi:hypothetical protein
MIEVKTPAEQFFDLDGSALDGGFIYIGASGANPETTPVAVYWDKAGTIPATQPIGTVSGYPYRLGAAAKFYTATKNYSITVRNSTGSLVISATNTDSGVFDELLTVSAAASIGYDNATSGMAADTVQEAVDELKATADALDATVEGLDLGTTGVINLFRNSAFLVNSNGYVSGAVTTIANQPTLDNINVVVLGESLAFTASTFGNKITAPAGGAYQTIEANRITGGDYACKWIGTGTIQVNGVARIQEETFTLPTYTAATITLFGEIEQFQLTRPGMLSQYEYDYLQDTQGWSYGPVTSLHGLTAQSFTGIPSWVNEIVIHFNIVSSSTTTNTRLRLGHAGGLLTTGYQSASVYSNLIGGSTGTGLTTGVFFTAGGSAVGLFGQVRIMRNTANIWSVSAVLNDQTSGVVHTGGWINVTAPLTQLELALASGTFDSSCSVNLAWRK